MAHYYTSYALFHGGNLYYYIFSTNYSLFFGYVGTEWRVGTTSVKLWRIGKMVIDVVKSSLHSYFMLMMMRLDDRMIAYLIR